MTNPQLSNKEMSNRRSAWAATGTGVFDILDEEVTWTITGSAPSGHSFHGRSAFLKGGFDPVAARFAGPIAPTIRGLFADGDAIVVRWDGVAPLKDGQVYRNSYAWFFTMRDGKVVEATAFLDLPTSDAATAGEPLPPRPVGPDQPDARPSA